MTAHQRGGMITQRFSEVVPQRCVADQHVRHTRAIANLEYRNTETDESRAMIHRLERHFGHAEWDERWCMRVHDRDHIGAQFVNFAMDIALREQRRHRQTVRVDRPAIEIELQNVFCGDEFGRQGHAP